MTALPALGWYTAFTHHWSLRFRSTGAVGYSGIDTTAGQPANAYSHSRYASGNLLWNPAGSLNVGVEYIYGTHVRENDDRAHASRVQFAAKYDLFRKRALGTQ